VEEGERRKQGEASLVRECENLRKRLNFSTMLLLYIPMSTEYTERGYWVKYSTTFYPSWRRVDSELARLTGLVKARHGAEAAAGVHTSLVMSFLAQPVAPAPFGEEGDGVLDEYRTPHGVF
jgi:hypothetical protein